MPNNITNNNSLLQKKQINVKNKNFRKRVENEENGEGKETQEKKNLNIVKIAKMNNEIKKKKGKINMQLRSSNYFLNSEKETQKILNIKLKLNLNNDEKKNERNSQKNIDNIFKKIDTPQTVYPTKLLTFSILY